MRIAWMILALTMCSSEAFASCWTNTYGRVVCTNGEQAGGDSFRLITFISGGSGRSALNGSAGPIAKAHQCGKRIAVIRMYRDTAFQCFNRVAGLATVI